MHTKRTQMPNTWPIPRKGRGQRFIASPSHFKNKSITILAIIRDLLKIVDTRKEVKHIVNNGDILINNKVRKNEKFPVFAFDTIKLEKLNKYYRLEIVNKKYLLKEIDEKQAQTKTTKIIGKKTLSKDKIQMNLEDGINLEYNKEFKVGDSIVFNTKENKIEKILPLKPKAKVEIIGGKHAGDKGEILSIEKMKRGFEYKIKLEKGREVLLPLKTFLVVN
ncbi:MAG: hypothetical protein WC260_02915 [Candidatus Pacearchaeota archaeon]